MEQNWKQRIRQGIQILMIVGPSLWMTFYSYPVQDDFHYAYYAKELMEQGYSLFHMAWYKTLDYYRTFCGCYTSTFLGYLCSAVIDCNVWGIRIYEFCSMVVFFLSCRSFFYAIFVRMLHFSKKNMSQLYLLLLACIHGVFYLADHEDYYWFITSVQYLTILSMILFGVSLLILAMESKPLFKKEKRKRTVLLAGASVLGFLGSGAALNIAFLCCILYTLVFVYYVFTKRKQWYSLLLVEVITYAGLFINGIAPGNYIRSGGTKGFREIEGAIIKSLLYAWERSVSMMKNPIFWMILILVIAVMLKELRKKELSFSFPMPITFTVVLFGLFAAMIFPVVLGYGYDVYRIMCRSNFISDFTLFVFTFLIVYYWIGFWLKRGIIARKESNYGSLRLKIGVVTALALAVLTQGMQIPYLRIMKEIVSHDASEYASRMVKIYEETAKEDGDFVYVDVDLAEENTVLISPKFCYGEYDPVVEYGNQTIARFYGKKAVYYMSPDGKEGFY